MQSRILVSLSLLWTVLGVRAQPADEFFHSGAQSYLSNNIPVALQTVTNGLQLHPDDEKLKRLYELLNQRQQQQQQQDQKDQKQDQQKQEQQKQEDKQDQKSQQQEKSEQQKKDDPKKQQDAKDKKDQSPSKPGEKSKDKPAEKKDAGEPQQVAAHAMTPEEAKQLLDAQKGDEQVLMFQPPSDPKRQEKKLKDW